MGSIHTDYNTVRVWTQEQISLQPSLSNKLWGGLTLQHLRKFQISVMVYNSNKKLTTSILVWKHFIVLHYISIIFHKLVELISQFWC